jgi:quercetin dioxygenase-like cupin family protein
VAEGIKASLTTKIRDMNNTTEVSKAFDPAKSVDYASGSVVSRTIVKKPTGTITLFAFDRGEGLSEHSAPFDAVVQLLDGKAEITIGGSPHLVEAGLSIILPANIPHSLHAVERFKMMLTMIKS